MNRTPRLSSSRDERFERRALAAGVLAAHREFAIDAADYIAAVTRRLELGAERYGPAGFLRPDRDNLRELLEETPDVAGYALLELQRLHATGHDDSTLVADLERVITLGAAADFYARRARARRETATA